MINIYCEINHHKEHEHYAYMTTGGGNSKRNLFSNLTFRCLHCLQLWYLFPTVVPSFCVGISTLVFLRFWFNVVNTGLSCVRVAYNLIQDVVLT